MAPRERVLLPVQETQMWFWSGLPCPPPEHLPSPGIEPRSPTLLDALCQFEKVTFSSSFSESFMDIDFCQMFFLPLLMWSCDFPPKLFNIVNYFHWFLYTEPILHYWNKLPNLVYDSLYILLGSIFLYFVKDFSSIVMRDICLSFFFLDCLCLVLVSE